MNIAVIGAGASGLCCAIEALQTAAKQDRHIRVAVYESKDRAGKKILATGNGRCNMMNVNEEMKYFSCPDFVEPILSRYNLESNLAFFRNAGLFTRSDEEGRVYPLSNQAASVLDALRFECERLGAELICGEEIKEIRRKGDSFIVSGKAYDKVVVACGSKAGVKGYIGYELLRNLGHSVTRLMPSLTKVNVADTTYTKQLRGIRHKAEVTLKIRRKPCHKEQGEILFADYGLSGIAVMQLSAYIARYQKNNQDIDAVISCDFIPLMDTAEVREHIGAIINHDNNMKAEHLLTGFMPKKLGEAVIKSLGYSTEKRVGEFTKEDIGRIADKAKDFTFEVKSLRGFEDAQVVSGGVSLKEFSPDTLESHKIHGLYCCGEILDVDGLCGGYNLWWAFSSGRAVGEAIMKGRTQYDKNKRG